jgi:ribosome-binding factor A
VTRPRKGGSRRPAPARASAVPRTARLNELLRQILADELLEIGDERLEHVSITSVDVDSELNRAIVFFDSMAGEAGDATVLEALSGLRIRLQRAIADQMRARRTPILEFRPDEVIRHAERIDTILRETKLVNPDGVPGTDEVPADEVPADEVPADGAPADEEPDHRP